MKRVHANRWLPFMVFAWGIVTTLSGLVKNFGGLVAIRLVLGMCEGGVLPGMVLYLSTMYKRNELQLRCASDYSFVNIPNCVKGWCLLRFRVYIWCIWGYVAIYSGSFSCEYLIRSPGIWDHEDERYRWFGRMALDFYSRSNLLALPSLSHY